MALQDILKKILDEAQTKVQEIERNNDEQKKKIDAEFLDIEKQDEKIMNEKIQSAITSTEKKMLSLSRRESSKLRLEMKHEVISDLMKQFLETLENADEKTYTQILEKLFGKMSLSSGKIYAPPKRLEVTSKCAPQGFDVVAHKNIVGGFVLESGDIKIDNSFRTLLFEEFAESFMLFFAEELKISV